MSPITWRCAAVSAVAAAALLTTGTVESSVAMLDPKLASMPTGPRAHQVLFRPGSRGVGDSYFPLLGNGGYNVRHYGLRLRYDPTTHHLGGSDRIIARATQNLSRFDLDLRGYRVQRVVVDRNPATFRRNGQELIITPANGLLSGHRFVVRVWYSGTPRTIVGSSIVFGGPYGWIYTKDGAFVGCEPNAAHTWYPSNDHPSDKARFTFAVTVPSTRRVVANGNLTRRHRIGSHTTYVWNERQPMATYLATLGIGRWQFHRTRTPRGIPEFVSMDPKFSRAATAHRIIDLTAEVTDYWVKTFGRYPFGSTGAIVDDVSNVGFSLETQTRPLYGFVPDSGTVSHELAHEWFGDSVTVTRWRHIWLNEGFATYASWLWRAHEGGRGVYRHARHIYRGVPSREAFWKQSIADPSRKRMFSEAVYLRGAMTLAFLRHKIGRTDMSRLLHKWARDHRYGNVTTRQFTSLAEQVSGRHLRHFFWIWLHRQSKPPLPRPS